MKYQMSYSRFEAFDACRFRFKLSVIDKIKQKPSFIMQKGIDLHQKLEYAIKGGVASLPDEFKMILPAIEVAIEQEAEAEVDLSITKRFEPTTFNDWNGVWIRGRADVIYGVGKSLVIVDYKSGNYYDKHIDQMAMMAMLAFCHYDTNRIDTQVWSGKVGVVSTGSYTRRKDFIKLKNKWLAKYNEVARAKKFDKNPQACKYCPYHVSNDGPCKGGEDDG